MAAPTPVTPSTPATPTPITPEAPATIPIPGA